MYSTVINDVSEYIKAIQNAEESFEISPLPIRYEFLFRGQSDARYKLIPSLGRYGSGLEQISFVEKNLISTAKRQLPNIFTRDLSPIELLSVLQHYGIPTRLLDVTENALVALFFACDGKEKQNGEVFVFKNDIDDVSEYPIDNAIAESYKFARPSFWPLEEFYKEIIQQPYFLEQRGILDKDELAGGRWVAECCKAPIFVYGTNRLERQKIQQGRYILFHNQISKMDAESDEKPGFFLPHIEPLSKDDDCIVGRIQIPADAKKKILGEIRMLGIDRAMLFADNVDIVCSEIKNQFFK